MPLLARSGHSGRRLRTSQWKARARARFWVEHGETVRILMVGGAIVAAASAVALVALR